MAWLTGKVQIDEPDYKPKTIVVGKPFAYEKDGKWFCTETHKELQVKKATIKLKTKKDLRPIIV